MTTISVVIPTYNRARLIVDAIESALEQTLPPTEIIVVDDGSSDDTRKALMPYADRVRYVYQENGGISNARNRGIREARGELIAFLDSDDLWRPEKLARQLDFISANPSVGLLHTDAVYRNEVTGETRHLPHPRHRYVGHCDSELFAANAIATPSVLVRKRCFERVGLFDEAIRGGRVEDRDMWLRIAREFEFGYLPERLVIVRVHDGNVSNDGGLMAESLLHVLEKNLSGNPGLLQKVGRARVRRTLRNAAFDAAYANLDRGEVRTARRYSWIAVRNAPTSIGTWGVCASTYMPRRLRSALKALKHTLRAAKL